jgi:5,10-methylenetetrahydromethanopterin reductase
MAVSELSASPGFSGLGLSLSNEDAVPETLALCRTGDALGFDEVSLPESRQHRSVFAVAAAVLATTPRIRVRIGIANPLTRHPAVLAMEAATLAEIGGPARLRFGIGAAEWTMRALGYAPDGWRPYTHTVEAVRAIRALLAGAPIGFAPTTFRAPADTRLDFTPAGPVPVDLGAVNARMMEAVGEVADGVQLGAITSAPYTAWAVARVAAGAARAGRSTAGILVSGNVLTSVGRSRREARDAVREVLAYYLWRVEGVVVDESGADPDAVTAVRRAVADGGAAAGAAVVSDGLIDTFAVAGTVDDVIAGLRPFAAAGLALPLAWHTLGPDPAWALEALAREVRPAVVAPNPPSM